MSTDLLPGQRHVSPGIFRILSASSKRLYRVTKTTCTCPGYEHRGECKHIKLVQAHIAECCECAAERATASERIPDDPSH